MVLRVAAQCRSGIIHNFELINKAARCLGEVPDMLSADDITSRYCDERAVLLFLSSLCPRLLAFASEGKAAHAIAKWWRWARVRLITLNPGSWHSVCEWLCTKSLWWPDGSI